MKLRTAGIAALVLAGLLAPAANATRITRFFHTKAIRASACLTVTVVQQTYVHPTALAAVERAAVDQSYQLGAAWGTPCIRFGAGGYTLTLTSGCTTSNGTTTCQLGGVHSPNGNMAVQTGALPYTLWVRPFTHEVVERLVNPGCNRWINNIFAEVADPVQGVTYAVDGVQVSDFVLPAYYNVDNFSGPWDEAHALTRPA